MNTKQDPSTHARRLAIIPDGAERKHQRSELQSLAGESGVVKNYISEVTIYLDKYIEYRDELVETALDKKLGVKSDQDRLILHLHYGKLGLNEVEISKYHDIPAEAIADTLQKYGKTLDRYIFNHLAP
ncbi:MAG: hypothetical protein KUG79_09600 [Pseudomonadales bacterium]|nr:hypothetical protein [Pseudomonadales bacterium]